MCLGYKSCTQLQYGRYKARHKILTNISGGGPYTLALTHLSPIDQVLGTVLVVPSTPSESPHPMRRLSTRWFMWQVRNFPSYVASNGQESASRLYDDSGHPVPSREFLPEHMLKTLRTSEEGRGKLRNREKSRNIKDRIYDLHNIIQRLGFRLAFGRGKTHCHLRRRSRFKHKL